MASIMMVFILLKLDSKTAMFKTKSPRDNHVLSSHTYVGHG
jgi:hypothetical protein